VLAELAYPPGDDGKRAQLDGAVVTAAADPTIVGRRLGDLAAERGITTPDTMIDIALAEELETRFTRAATSNINLGLLDRLLVHPAVLIGASDAGAHVRSFSTYGDSGYVFARFVRERRTMSAEQAVRRLTKDQADAWGLRGRGVLEAGAAGDVMIFDPATLDRGPDLDVADLPAGHRRYLRRSVGVHTTIVNGQVAWSAADGYAATSAGSITPRS
jgi:N-acyl-D-aspartate/D-glutamate deacylase